MPIPEKLSGPTLPIPAKSGQEDPLRSFSDDLIRRLSLTVKEAFSDLKIGNYATEYVEPALSPAAVKMPESIWHSKFTEIPELIDVETTYNSEIENAFMSSFSSPRASPSVPLRASPSDNFRVVRSTDSAWLSQNCSASSKDSVTKKASLANVRDGGAFCIDLKERGVSPGHATGDSFRVEEAIDLYRKFVAMDDLSEGFVAPESLLLEGSDVVNPVLREAVSAINDELGDNHTGPRHMMSLETFKVMMLADPIDLESRIFEHATVILEVRESSVKDKMNTKIADTCRVDGTVLKDGNHGGSLHAYVEMYLEPLVALMVLMNSLTIGISLDHDPTWTGWSVAERFFTAFFTMEFVIKLRIFGVADYYLGEDWSWNWFDTLLVMCAIIDSAITLYAEFADIDVLNLASLTVVRLVRLVRITRLVRLLHLPMFKELTLMVHGIFEGIRTLFWAIVLLITLVYALGVLTRQILDPADLDNECAQAVADGLMLPSGNFGPGAKCTRGGWMLHTYGDVLFANVGRSMLTVFLCFTDSCTTPDGSPLLWHFWDVYGIFFIICYVLVFIFITFGIFNLILAIFVENTLVSAQVSRQQRTSRRHVEQVRQAKKLKQLMVKICATANTKDDSPASFKSMRGLRKHLRRITTGSKDDVMLKSQLNMRVNQEEFEEALDKDEVRVLLEDLDVSITSRDQLFDILDADGNGYLSVNELVDGILKLRGPADKGDTVSAVLMIRNMQKHIRRFEEAVLHNQNIMKDLMRTTQQLGQTRPSTEKMSTRSTGSRSPGSRSAPI